MIYHMTDLNLFTSFLLIKATGTLQFIEPTNGTLGTKSGQTTFKWSTANLGGMWPLFHRNRREEHLSEKEHLLEEIWYLKSIHKKTHRNATINKLANLTNVNCIGDLSLISCCTYTYCIKHR